MDSNIKRFHFIVRPIQALLYVYEAPFTVLATLRPGCLLYSSFKRIPAEDCIVCCWGVRRNLKWTSMDIWEGHHGEKQKGENDKWPCTAYVCNCPEPRTHKLSFLHALQCEYWMLCWEENESWWSFYGPLSEKYKCVFCVMYVQCTIQSGVVKAGTLCINCVTRWIIPPTINTIATFTYSSRHTEFFTCIDCQ